MPEGLCHLKMESFSWVMKALVFMVWPKTFPTRENISELYMATSTAKFPRSNWRRAELPVNLLCDAEQSPSPQQRLAINYWLPWKCTVSHCKTPQRAIQITFRISYLHCNGHGRSLNVATQIWYQMQSVFSRFGFRIHFTWAYFHGERGGSVKG